MRFLLFLFGIIAIANSATQVYEHWSPADQNQLVYAFQSFFRFFLVRGVILAIVGAAVLAVAVALKLRPPVGLAS